MNDQERVLRELLAQETKKFKDFRSKAALFLEKAKKSEQDIAAINQLLASFDIEKNLADVPKEALPAGFRDAVRAVLKEFPGGLTNAEIREVMTERGYDYDSLGMETPFGMRMGNELNRMKKQGQIRKDGGKHILTEKGRGM